jgi:ABC-type glutathione transport system ATPase component
VLSARGLRKEFTVRGRGRVVAVDDVSFDVPAGRTTALVGESGSGKSTLLRLIMGLHRPDAGSVELDGVPLLRLRGRSLRRERAHYQMVFQNPLLSFDPVYTLGASIWEVMRLSPEQPADRAAAIADLLLSVGLSADFADAKPRSVSGGELQRASIARAMSVHPKLLVLDEPTSALDVSIQAQVLTLLASLQRDRAMAYLLATHDLPMVRRISHEVIVLFGGRLVERAGTPELFTHPTHPYTASLLAVERGPEAVAEALTPAVGDGDPCPLTGEACPEPLHVVETTPGHLVRCWRGFRGPGVAA